MGNRRVYIRKMKSELYKRLKLKYDAIKVSAEEMRLKEFEEKARLEYCLITLNVIENSTLDNSVLLSMIEDYFWCPSEYYFHGIKDLAKNLIPKMHDWDEKFLKYCEL